MEGLNVIFRLSSLLKNIFLKKNKNKKEQKNKYTSL